MLDKEKIKHELIQHQCTIPFKLHVFDTIDSTNTFLKTEPNTQMVDVCCAEVQTQGRGRFGRQWHSPFGENIYCSSRWNLDCDLSKLGGLSLISSLAILAAINDVIDQQHEIKIKWPNDLIWRNKKLCGNLIELLHEPAIKPQVIIGIGLNVNSDTLHNPLPDQAWCSLFEIFQQKFDRNLIIATVLTHLDKYLKLFWAQGLKPFMEEWNEYDYLAGKYITVKQSLDTLSGICQGIDSAGLLLLKDEQEVIHYLASGDCSLSENHYSATSFTLIPNPSPSREKGAKS